MDHDALTDSSLKRNSDRYWNRPVSLEEVLIKYSFWDAQDVVDLAIQEKLPILVDADNNWILDEDGVPLFHPLALEIADTMWHTMALLISEDTDPPIVTLATISARGLIIRYEKLAAELWQSGEISAVIQRKLDVLRALDGDPFTKPLENREC